MASELGVNKMEKLQSGAKWIFRLRAYPFLGIFGIFLILVLISATAGGKGIGWPIILIGIIFWLILVFGISEIFAQLAYNNWHYEFTATNLKLQRGIIWKRYSNVPYERVQNVDVYRGILARMLGFSTINIQTAGYHAYARRGITSEGHIPAVGIKAAEHIREFLMKKISHKGGGV